MLLCVFVDKQRCAKAHILLHKCNKIYRPVCLYVQASTETQSQAVQWLHLWLEKEESDQKSYFFTQ